MATQLWANEAGTTLAAAITSIATSLTVTNGSTFPVPVAGQAFQLTLTSATNSSFQEIVSCTARSGSTLTIIRGQEGTTPQAFNAGDLAQNLITAGSLQSLANINGSSAQAFNVSPAVTSTEAVALSQLSAYLPINNPAATGNLTATGNITASGELVSDGPTLVKGVLTVNNGANITGSLGVTGALAVGSNINAGNLTTSGNIAANGQISATGDVISHAYLVATNGATGTLNSNIGTILGDFPGGTGWTGIPSTAISTGYIIQMGTVNVPANNTLQVYAFPRAFPSVCIAIVISYGALTPPASGNIGAQPASTTAFYATNTSTAGGFNGCNWIAIGY